MNIQRIFKIDSVARKKILKSVVLMPTMAVAINGLADANGQSLNSPESPSLVKLPGSWQGLYAGLSVGAAPDANNQFGELIDLSSGNGSPGAGGGIGILDTRTNPSDMTAGLFLGHNWQYDNTVLGIEADVNSYGALDNFLGSLRGRIGFGADRYLLYATAGPSYISIDKTTSSKFVGGNGGSGGMGGNGLVGGQGGEGGMGLGTYSFFRDNSSDVGLVAGLGAEYRLSNDVTLGLEGLYYWFDDKLSDSGYDNEFYVIRARISMYLDGNSAKLPMSSALSDNWAGIYFGGNLGAIHSTNADSIDSIRNVNGQNGVNGANGTDIHPLDGAGGGGGGGGGGATVGLFDSKDMSLSGGLQLGYNWQSDHLVYGLEVDADLGGNDRDYLLSLRGRLGRTYNSFLLYLTGGMAFTRIDGEKVLFAGNAGSGGNGSNSVNFGGTGVGGNGGPGGISLASSNKEDLIGFVIGAGVDKKITNNMSVGIEGLYYSFAGDDGDVNQYNGMNGTALASKDDSSAFVIRGRLNVLF